MGMLEQAQADIKRIRTDPAGFTKSLAFTSPDGQQATIYGMFAKIHMATDTDGNAVNVKKAHVSVSESALTDLGYTTRDAGNLCTLKNHKVLVTDSTGVVYSGIIREIFPDDTIGLIVCFLGDFE